MSGSKRGLVEGARRGSDEVMSVEFAAIRNSLCKRLERSRAGRSAMLRC